MAELLRPFEVEIIGRWKAGGWRAVSPKASWIFGHLMEVGSDYPYRMWIRWVEFCKIAQGMGAYLRVGTYQAFRTYIFILTTKLGLLRRVRRERPIKGRRRQYYALVPEKVPAPEWARPMQSAYPSTDWMRLPPEERHRLRLKYRRK